MRQSCYHNMNFEAILRHKIKFSLWAMLRPLQIKRLRSKKKIKVLFLVCDLTCWKSEKLFKEMQEHPRFEPVIGVFEAIEIPNSHVAVINYCSHNGFNYVFLSPDKTIKQQVGADLVFYQKPYVDHYPPKLQYNRNLNVLQSYLSYGSNSILNYTFLHNLMFEPLWQLFFENSIIAKESKSLSWHNGKNIVVTGVPVMDELNSPKSEYHDPWLDHSGRKRIIYAPHHTFGNDHMEGLQCGTFLETGWEILRLAKKYQKDVFFAFKPHPLLRKKLNLLWGEEKTNEYFWEWETLENAQVENGVYIGLFKYSDAMIHDCNAFTLEYLTMDKPVMFLVKDDNLTNNMNTIFKMAHEQHYRGKVTEDIEGFIKNVINGNDPMSESRKSFVAQALKPPYGKTASRNIINAILGIEEYKNN